MLDLDLPVQLGITGECVQHLRQARHAHALRPFGVHRAGIERRQFRRGEIDDRPRAIRRAIDGGVVVHHQLAIFRQPDIELEGIDAELDYRTSLKLVGGGPETLSARVFATYLISREDISATVVVTRFDGLTGIAPDTGVVGMFPKWKANFNLTYNNGPFTWFTQVRYIGSGKNAYRIGGFLDGQEDAVEGVNIEDNSVPAVAYVDMRFDYTFDIGNSSLDLYASVTNLFDKSPPVTPTYQAFGGYTTQANTSLFDVLGRRFTVGAKFRL